MVTSTRQTMDSNALARLKAVAGRQTLTLTHYGRTSGKPYDVTIWFAVAGDKSPRSVTVYRAFHPRWPAERSVGGRFSFERVCRRDITRA